MLNVSMRRKREIYKSGGLRRWKSHDLFLYFYLLCLMCSLLFSRLNKGLETSLSKVYLESLLFMNDHTCYLSPMYTRKVILESKYNEKRDSLNNFQPYLTTETWGKLLENTFLGGCWKQESTWRYPSEDLSPLCPYFIAAALFPLQIKTNYPSSYLLIPGHKELPEPGKSNDWQPGGTLTKSPGKRSPTLEISSSSFTESRSVRIQSTQPWISQATWQPWSTPHATGMQFSGDPCSESNSSMWVSLLGGRQKRESSGVNCTPQSSSPIFILNPLLSDITSAGLGGSAGGMKTITAQPDGLRCWQLRPTQCGMPPAPGSHLRLLPSPSGPAVCATVGRLFTAWGQKSSLHHS